jgi:AraC-like DNA-binding protein
MVTNIPHYSTEKVLGLSGIEVYSFDEMYKQKIKEEAYSYHRASFYHIFWYKGNGNNHYVQNKKIKVKHNNLLIINCNILNRYSRHKCIGDTVLFDAATFGCTREKVDFLNHCTLFKNDYIIISSESEDFIASVGLYFSLMKIQLEEKIQKTKTILQSNWLHNLLIIIEREYRMQQNQTSSNINSENYVQQFKDLLDMHFRTEKQVHFYAEKLNLSERKLSRMVFTVHGISAKKYIRENISLKAIQLLENTTLNQGEIAVKLGFEFTYFIKFFRKRFNITPLKYRQEKKA